MIRNDMECMSFVSFRFFYYATTTRQFCYRSNDYPSADVYHKKTAVIFTIHAAFPWLRASHALVWEEEVVVHIIYRGEIPPKECTVVIN